MESSLGSFARVVIFHQESKQDASAAGEVLCLVICFVTSHSAHIGHNAAGKGWTCQSTCEDNLSRKAWSATARDGWTRAQRANRYTQVRIFVQPENKMKSGVLRTGEN
jgi:hypothetical protein